MNIINQKRFHLFRLDYHKAIHEFGHKSLYNNYGNFSSLI